MTSSAPRIQSTGGLGSTPDRSAILKWVGAMVLSTPRSPGAKARPGVHGARVAGIPVLAGPGGQHRLHEDVQVLGLVRRLDVVREQHLPRRQRAFVRPVLTRQRLHEIGGGGAAAGTR